MRCAGILILAFVAAATADDSKLDAAIARSNRAIANRLVDLGRKASRAGAKAGARDAFERALLLDPDHAKARRELGYKRKSGEWARTTAKERDVGAWKDKDANAAKEFEAEADAASSERAARILAACREHGTPETSRPHLLALIEADPKLEEAHELLGHERIGGRFVRPELAELARAMPDQEKAWQAMTRATVDATLLPETFPLAAAPKAVSVYQVGGRRVAMDLTGKDGLRIAGRTEATYALLQHVLGTDFRGRSPVVAILSPPRWKDFLKERFPNPQMREAARRGGRYLGADGLVMPRGGVEERLDSFGQAIGSSAAAAAVGGQARLQPWYIHGVAYLVTLEAYGTAMSGTFARESMAKVREPPPLPPTRKRCREWVRRVAAARTEYRLAELFPKPFNEVTMSAGIQVASFLRFLSLYDAAATRKLPAAMAKLEGTRPEVARRAIESSFGKTVEQLEALWRAFVIEVDAE